MKKDDNNSFKKIQMNWTPIRFTLSLKSKLKKKKMKIYKINFGVNLMMIKSMETIL